MMLFLCVGCQDFKNKPSDKEIIPVKEDSLSTTIQEVRKYDPTNVSIFYKSNLSNVLIRQGKFEQAIRLLSEVINTETSSTRTISERLLRSEA